ncbi:hypothetical protein GPECTOR_10g984 [Gonium pectorale]|uniref:Uncharacterized protein n=1 Tax=Gonium pectorale TaxID=33097 RepID=A0A150GSP6_GONPE|nr:hypothetical protein GPECTOR_10g984 [Gonium pectorale]|eukprot:KXZ52350.1 hypothetical protein GPECTOR_10g984 [Gonium pectorale]
MEVQAALQAVSRLPALRSLQLCALPLLPGAAPPLAAHLGGLTRLVLTLEHRHAGLEAQLAGLGGLSRLRHLGLDFNQLGTGSSLWSAGGLLAASLSALSALTSLQLPRAFLDASAQPACLAALAALTGLRDLALGSFILGEGSVERAAAASATATAVAAPQGGAECGGGECGSPAGRPAPAALAAAGSAALAAALRRPWRRLALGAAMPCYLEVLLPLMTGAGAGPEPWWPGPGLGTGTNPDPGPGRGPALAAAGSVGGGGGGGGGVGEVSLLLRLGGNWREVVAALPGLGGTLRGLALLPTYMYGSGTMMGPEVVSAVAAALPWLAHLELHRLNTDPWDVAVLAGMPRLRYAFLGIAEQACERRGSGHPAATVRSLLEALQRAAAGVGTTRDGAGVGGLAGAPAFDADGDSCVGGIGGGAHSVAASPYSEHPGPRANRAAGAEADRGDAGGVAAACPEVVVCCPQLSEAEVERLGEACETEYGDIGGRTVVRLRVERCRARSLASRLAVPLGPARGG